MAGRDEGMGLPNFGSLMGRVNGIEQCLPFQQGARYLEQPITDCPKGTAMPMAALA